jgi:hypothetical protein
MGKPAKDTIPLIRFISTCGSVPPSTCMNTFRDIEDKLLDVSLSCSVASVGGVTVGEEEML